MTMKRCTKCKTIKRTSEFSPRATGAGGRNSQCTSCVTAMARARYAANPERAREAARGRYKPRPLRTRTVRAVEYVKEYDRLYPERRYAHNVLNSAVRYGRIVKPTSCTNCGKAGCRIEGHHEDHFRPLDVVWLCTKCHRSADAAKDAREAAV